MASELSRVWKQVDRQSVSSKELMCFFYRDTADEVQQLQQQLRQSRGGPEDRDNEVLTQVSAPKEGLETIKSCSQAQDTVMLQRKYDEVGGKSDLVWFYIKCSCRVVLKLMEVVAQLTLKRDTLAKDLATTQQQLQQVTIYARDVWEAAQQETRDVGL
ncbi:hypothetical protein DVH05_007444 [Phytophthora capsici]|nr:hypothetical protein DVH05_007444 [Phytophthora capsici]